ncbi:hypothetical protein DSCA_35800 [Desulfosarcina alkanivorans]|uniref:CHAT domain-containing protein n=1 Tax=Desulfosarcina alkanivorans TaxID=571177 RepID=A0A5K7YN09_9BACT|nr:hypothetical protein [Desulfosarcina alkanivorans]BBO69650.1 hypothetical protein DSCA_35800 [Desulfosarcina alkanivorans]
MDDETLFNKVWVIESLRKEDRETGKSLYNDVLLPISLREKNLRIEIACPTDKESFFKVLSEVEKEAKAGLYPIIHLECHGSIEGLQLTNFDTVSWEDLRDVFIRINIASQLNTVIVVAACNGIYLINVATILDRAAFWAVIGPVDEISDLELKRDFSAFYETFFKTMSGDEAVNALNKGVPISDRVYHFRSSQALFKRAFLNYHQTHCVGKGKKIRLEALISEAMKDPATRAKGVNWVRKRIKAELSKERKQFIKFKDRFFMIDLFQKNAERFSLSYEDVIETFAS